MHRLLKDLVGDRQGSDEAAVRSGVHQKLSFAVQRQVAQQLLVMLTPPEKPPQPPATSSVAPYTPAAQAAACALTEMRAQRTADALRLATAASGTEKSRQRSLVPTPAAARDRKGLPPDQASPMGISDLLTITDAQAQDAATAAAAERGTTSPETQVSTI